MIGARALLAAALGVEHVSDCVTDSPRDLLSAPDAELAALGLTPSQLERVKAIVALAREAAEPLQRGQPMRDASDLFRYFHPRTRDLRVEQFHVVLLDGRYRIIEDVLVSQGTLTSSPVHPREVFAPAVRMSRLHHDEERNDAPRADKPAPLGERVLDAATLAEHDDGSDLPGPCAKCGTPCLALDDGGVCCGGDPAKCENARARLAERLETLAEADVYTDAPECESAVETLQNAIASAVRCMREVRS